MDKALEDARKAGSQPFSGVTLSCTESLPISRLRSALNSIVDALQTLFPATPILKFDDWHEHDGFVSPSKESSFGELTSLLSSDESLYQARQGDTYVRRAFYPRNKAFLLRFYTPDEYEIPKFPEFAGDFDLTSSSEIIHLVHRKLVNAEINNLELLGAQEFSNTRYAG